LQAQKSLTSQMSNDKLASLSKRIWLILQEIFIIANN
jgi:hypothetical protein